MASKMILYNWISVPSNQQAMQSQQQQKDQINQIAIKVTDFKSQMFVNQTSQTAREIKNVHVNIRSGVPGPGSYNPQYESMERAKTSYRIGTQNRLVDFSTNSKNPGPGQYETSKSTLAKDYAASLGKGKKINFTFDSKTPGPGQYEMKYHEVLLANEPKIVFSRSERTHSMNTIGPGRFYQFYSAAAYPIRNEIQGKSKGYSFGQKRQKREEFELRMPGPGAYNTVQINKKIPSFSIGKSPRLKIQNLREMLNKPGPSSYDAKISAFDKNSFLISKQKRKGLETQTHVPGPGAYELFRQKSSSLSFSISKSDRKFLGIIPPTPGPQKYSPQPVFSGEYQSIGIGLDQRRTFLIKSQAPGPGSYIRNELKKNLGFTICKQKRSLSKQQTNPGPGSYEIPSSMFGKKGEGHH